MRLLIASAYDPINQMHGQGVIIRNTLVAAADLGLQLSIGLSLFRDGARANTQREVEGRVLNVEHSQLAAELSRGSMIRSLFRFPLTRVEKEYLRHTATIASRYDALLWFGSPYDPVTHHIAKAVRCPVVYHATDSVMLHEERRVGHGAYVRRAIAACMEEMALERGGFAASIYVGAADVAHVKQLITKENRAKIIYLPNGVNVDIFYPRTNKNSRRPTILFAGSMCYAPNIQAAIRLVREILPLLRSQPMVRIVGHSPTPKVIELADSTKGRVVVTGRVDDISIEYGNADLLVAPIEMGAGIQNKVLEALASGVPVVTSPLVAAGMSGEIPGVYVCRTLHEYAKIIDHLLSSERLRQDSGAAGRAHIKKCLTWKKRTLQLIELLGAILQKPLPKAEK